MRPMTLKTALAECSRKYFGGSGGSKEALVPQSFNEKPIGLYTTLLSKINTDVKHVTFGSRTVSISEVDSIGDTYRGDHTSLSTIFTYDHTFALINHGWQDIANMNIGGTYEAKSIKTKKGKPNSSIIFSVVTPGDNVQLTDGRWRNAGENGSVYFSVSFVNGKPDLLEWNKLRVLIELIYRSANKNKSFRGAFIDTNKSKTPIAFSILEKEGKKAAERRIEVCDHGVNNNRSADLNELLKQLDQVFEKGNPTNFYLAGTFDI